MMGEIAFSFLKPEVVAAFLSFLPPLLQRSPRLERRYRLQSMLKSCGVFLQKKIIVVASS